MKRIASRWGEREIETKTEKEVGWKKWCGTQAAQRHIHTDTHKHYLLKASADSSIGNDNDEDDDADNGNDDGDDETDKRMMSLAYVVEPIKYSSSLMIASNQPLKNAQFRQLITRLSND